MELKFFQKHPLLKDLLSLTALILITILIAQVISKFTVKMYNVVGSSMENTLEDGDRLAVNRLAVSMAHFLGNEYVPERGQIIVFANADEKKIAQYRADGAKDPLTCKAPSNVQEQYIIKRVIAFPGERVVVADGVLTVYNEEYPDGFQPDLDWRVDENNGPKDYTSGEIDIVVPEGELFVSGDNRDNRDYNGGSHSYDSRNGLGTIPYCRVVGPVMLRFFPFNRVRTF